MVLNRVVLPQPFGPSRQTTSPSPRRKLACAPDWLAAIAEGQILDLEAHGQPSRPRARSHRKNGAPRKAVRMPSGTSVTAMVRASVSTIRR